MRILLATPAPPGSQRGNRVTAERWAGLLGELGHEVILCDGEALPAQADAQLLIAIHARASHGALMEFRRRFPARPTVLVLAGTDLYLAGKRDELVATSLAEAHRIVLLQQRARAELTEEQSSRAVVIEQSCAGPPRDPQGRAAATLSPRPTADDILLVGHLRPVKDPLLAPAALAELEDDNPLRLVHLGAALDPDLAEKARACAASCPRYTYLGERCRQETLLRMAHCRALVLTSRAEGGANAITEAIACGAPIIATDNAGTRGQLGDDHPGLFPVGDKAALVHLFRRLTADPDYASELRAATARLAPRVEPARERMAWAQLLESL